VTTSKGTFEARYVVCTLPLGVLQARLDSLFPSKTPRLSAGKVAAIKSLGMGAAQQGGGQMITCLLSQHVHTWA